jgi:3-oxoacyl-(acyl-carrier-protein) synthase
MGSISSLSRATEQAFTRAGLERPCPVHPAGLVVEVDDPEHGWNELKATLQGAGKDGWRHLPPLWILNHLPNTTASHLAIQFGLRGPAQTIPRQAVGNHPPLQTAMDWLETGEARLVLAVRASRSLPTRALLLGDGQDGSGSLLPPALDWDSHTDISNRERPAS